MSPRPQVRLNLPQQGLRPVAQPVDTYASPAVPIPKDAVGNDWLEAAKALAPLTQSVTSFLQSIEKDRRGQAPEEAKQIIAAFNGDLSFLKDMPTMSREDAAAYLKDKQAEFPGLKDEYAARPDFVLYAQALAGSRYVREAQVIEGADGSMMTVSEALNGRLEEAMQPGVDAAAIRKEVREQFLETIGTPQSEAWNMALLDGLTPLENAWDQRVREGKASNVAWQADQDFQENMSSALFDLSAHLAHPATPDEEPANESQDEATRRQERNAANQSRHDETTAVLSERIKNIYNQAGKVGDRKRNANLLTAIEQMLREVAADDEDGLELAEALEMLQGVEYADGQALGSSRVFREGLSKIELEIRREQAALERSKEETGNSDTQSMSIAAHDIVMPRLLNSEAEGYEEARQEGEKSRGEVEKFLKDNGLDPRLASTVLDDAASFYAARTSGDPAPNTPAAREAVEVIERLIGLGDLAQAEAEIIGRQEALGAHIGPLMEELQTAKDTFRGRDFVSRQIENLGATLFPQDSIKTLRPSALTAIDDLKYQAEQDYEEAMLALPLTEREDKALEVRRQIEQKYADQARTLLEDASVVNNPDQLIEYDELQRVIEQSAKLQLDIRGRMEDDDGDGIPDREVLAWQDQIAVDQRIALLTRAARDQARALVNMDWGDISQQEKVQAIRNALINGDPDRGIGGYGVWMQPAILPRKRQDPPSTEQSSVNQRKIEARPAQESAQFLGVESYLKPLVSSYAGLRGEPEERRMAALDLVGTTTGYLGGDLPFFNLQPLSRGEAPPNLRWDDPEVREALDTRKTWEGRERWQKGLSRYQQFYPSKGRTMRLYLAGMYDGLPLPDEGVSSGVFARGRVDHGFDQIGQGLKPLSKASSEQVLPYLREAVSATGLSFAEIGAGRIAEGNVEIAKLFPGDTLFSSGTHLGPFDPKAFEKEVSLFMDEETRKDSAYYKAFEALGFDPDAPMLGIRPDGTAYPAEHTQGVVLLDRIKGEYDRRYRDVPASDLAAMDIPLHALGRFQVNEAPPVDWRVHMGFGDSQKLEQVEDVPLEDLDPTVHGPLIQHVVRRSQQIYSEDD